MITTHVHSLSNLLVNANVHLDALLGFALEQAVQTELREIRGRSAEVQLRTEPPIKDEDALSG